MQDFASDCIHVETPALRFPLQRHVRLDSDFWADRIPELPGHKLGVFSRVNVGAQLVTTDASHTLDSDNALGGDANVFSSPLLNGLLGNSQCLGKTNLTSRRLNRALNGFHAR